MTRKIHILFDFKEGPWGGGNQFLKGLRNYFLQNGYYEEDPLKADIILFNSDKASIRNLTGKIANLRKHDNKVIVNRIDGPLSIRNMDKSWLAMDKAIIKFDTLFCDASIFQSQWVYDQMRLLGYRPEHPFTIIPNSSDPKIFFSCGISKDHETNAKIRLIATSWSNNINKGFDIYSYLDENLDFSRFELYFIGNSPIKFKKIIHIPPVDSKRLGEYLRSFDIYITASRNEPCSNALIEAMNCGLPAIAHNSGGNPEIIKGAGEYFEDIDDILGKIDLVARDLEFYRARIDIGDIDEVGQRYINFMRNIAINSGTKQFRIGQRISGFQLQLYIILNEIRRKIMRKIR